MESYGILFNPMAVWFGLNLRNPWRPDFWHNRKVRRRTSKPPNGSNHRSAMVTEVGRQVEKSRSMVQVATDMIDAVRIIVSGVHVDQKYEFSDT